jgi:UDP-N-acetylglucosamine/UDP-N-acetylgalactosamine diphosphorylase
MVADLIKASKYVQVIGVDNVLNKVLDPLQVGYMSHGNLDASLKVCVKCDAAEKVGVVCKKNGIYDIVEYSEISEEDCTRKADDGSLFLELGSILIFMLSSEKLLSLASNTETLNQLYHVAHKKLEYWSDSENKTVKPDTENGYKFELFLHNFLSFIKQGEFGAIKVVREDEFAPVKNADGAATDTPTIAR